jgi:hypothetical protein
MGEYLSVSQLQCEDIMVLTPLFSRISQQAQLYYSGKSRYIGVFDSREKAALAYEIAREVLKEDKGDGPLPQEVIDKNVSLARQAAFAGVNGTPTS